MPPETTYSTIERLGDPQTQEWKGLKMLIEKKNKDLWSRACGPDPTVVAKLKLSTTSRPTPTAPLKIVTEAISCQLTE